MAEKIYNWTDDPMVSGVADCNTDVVNDCLMHLKYENTSDAIQNMYETGQVEKQSRAFNQLLSMRRSTFDKSKFTVVGNPTITDDGVASGFSASDYLKTSYFPQPQNEIIIKTEAIRSTTPNTSPYEQSMQLWAMSSTSWRLQLSGTQLRVYALAADNQPIINYPKLQGGELIETEVILRANEQIINLWIDGVKYNTVTNYKLSFSSQFLSVPSNSNYYWTGSIDLSQFSITVDGKEVFSGNKTGIDNIKADNYEVVGSPTISDDGVIKSPFQPNNYIKKELIALGDNFRIKFKAGCNSIINNTSATFVSLASSTSPDLSFTYGEQQYVWVVCYVNNNGVRQIEQKGVATIHPLNTYITYEFKQESVNGVYKRTLITYNKNSKIGERTWESSYPLWGSNYKLELCHNSSIKDCSFDLNSFKVYVDGNLVYQPCLKIPYTRADSKSKIVDVAYRDRVQDLYEQEGLAGYYTIDEENQNFTLPMGEIYGMIEQAKSSADSTVSKSGDTMTGQLQIDVRPENDTTTPLLLFQKKASDFGASTCGSILFRNSNNEDVGVVGSVENTDGSHRMRLMFKDGSNWVEMPQIIDPYRNGKSGYNIYTNGYCEQWGWIGSGTGTGSVRYNFLKPFANDNFNIEYSIASNDSHTRWANQMSLNGWDVNGFNAMNVGGFGAYWCARGYV